MNSINRLGVAVAGLATVAAVGGAFVVQGYVGARQAADPTSGLAAASATPDPTAEPTDSLAPQTIYVNPLPTPPVVKIVATAPPARPTKKPPVIHIVVPAPGGDDGENDD